MAFWTKASSCNAAVAPRPAAGPAKPLTVLLHSPSDFNTLVRLRVRRSGDNKQSETMVDEGDEDSGAVATQAASSMAHLHQLIMAVEGKSADAANLTITEVLEPPDMLQMLCQKASAGKVYKGLMPHQSTLGFSLGDVKSCISLTPLGSWELHEALQTAVIKAVTGSSCGTCSNSSTDLQLAGQAADAAAAADKAEQQQQWMCLSRNKLIGSNVLTSKPGDMKTAPLVEFEARGQPPNKVLLLIKSAGTVKFRLLSPMQALAADAKAVTAPLQLSDTDEALSADKDKLAAAARRLGGRQVKLLPDERPAFIKSLQVRPADPAVLQQLSTYWLGSYGLLLPEKYPFLIGVAGHPEAEDASMLVSLHDSLTNTGSNPGGKEHSSAVQQLLHSIQGSKLNLLGAGGFKVEADASPAGLTDSMLQVSQCGSQANSTAASLQPKQFSLDATWTTAKDISKLQAAAKAELAAAVGKQAVPGAAVKSASKQAAAPAVLTSSTAQLLGLQEVTDAALLVADPAGEPSQRRPVLARQDINQFSKLKQYLEEKRQEREAAAATSTVTGAIAGISSKKPTTSVAASKPALKRPVPGGPPAVPKFGSRKPGAAPVKAVVQKPTAAQQLLARAKAAAKAVAAANSGVDADGADAADSAAPGRAAAAGITKDASASPHAALAILERPAAPAVGQKRPAAVKPAAAKKAKTDGTKAKATESKVKAAAKTQTPAAAVQIPAVEAAAAATPPATAETTAASAPAAAPAAKKAKTKASDLDVAAVTAKVMAAYKAGGGTSLKGLNVPEMQCYLRAHGQKGGPTKKAEVEARLIALLATKPAS